MISNEREKVLTTKGLNAARDGDGKRQKAVRKRRKTEAYRKLRGDLVTAAAEGTWPDEGHGYFLGEQERRRIKGRDNRQRRGLELSGIGKKKEKLRPKICKYLQSRVSIIVSGGGNKLSVIRIGVSILQFGD